MIDFDRTPPRLSRTSMTEHRPTALDNPCAVGRDLVRTDLSDDADWVNPCPEAGGINLVLDDYGTHYLCIPHSTAIVRSLRAWYAWQREVYSRLTQTHKDQ